jgi:hypothetical protein
MRFVIKFFVLIAAIYCFSGFAAGEAMAKSMHWKPQEKRHDTRWERSTTSAGRSTAVAPIIIGRRAITATSVVGGAGEKEGFGQS